MRNCVVVLKNLHFSPSATPLTQSEVWRSGLAQAYQSSAFAHKQVEIVENSSSEILSAVKFIYSGLSDLNDFGNSQSEEEKAFWALFFYNLEKVIPNSVRPQSKELIRIDPGFLQANPHWLV
jgi:hypothetical protein